MVPSRPGTWSPIPRCTGLSASCPAPRGRHGTAPPLDCCSFLALIGCSEPDDPIPVQAQAGYYYHDQLIPLTVDARTLTLELDSDLPAGALVTRGVEGSGAHPDSVTRFQAFGHHWRVWLPSGTTSAQALNAARRLRGTPAVRFASTPYWTTGSNPCSLLLFNEMGVLFEPGTTLDAIGALNARVGTTVRSDVSHLGGVWSIAYPVGTPHTPLDIAAYLDRQPLVVFAELSWTGCLVLEAPREE